MKKEKETYQPWRTGEGCWDCPYLAQRESDLEDGDCKGTPGQWANCREIWGGFSIVKGNAEMVYGELHNA
jgi:hypothetical protein